MNLVLAHLLLLPLATALLNGDTAKWGSHASIVKVAARRSSTSDGAIGCTGTMLTPKLVLTSTDCVMRDGKRLPEIIVVIPRALDKPSYVKSASIADINGTIAVLALNVPMLVKELCPTPGHDTGRVIRLPITPTLSASSIMEIDAFKLDKTTCRARGFQSEEGGAKFLSNDRIVHGGIKITAVTDGTFEIKRDTRESLAACFEDPGVPLECLIGESYVQMGVFTSLVAAIDDGAEVKIPSEKKTRGKREDHDDEEKEKKEKKEKEDKAAEKNNDEVANGRAISRCLSSSRMTFARLDLGHVASVIEKYDFHGFIRVHKDCFPAADITKE